MFPDACRHAILFDARSRWVEDRDKGFEMNIDDDKFDTQKKYNDQVQEILKEFRPGDQQREFKIVNVLQFTDKKNNNKKIDSVTKKDTSKNTFSDDKNNEKKIDSDGKKISVKPSKPSKAPKTIKECYICKTKKGSDDFSKLQWKKSRKQRDRCCKSQSCIEENKKRKQHPAASKLIVS